MKRTIEMNRAEYANKAYDGAEFLVGDLRDLHKTLCMDKPTVAERIAEARVLALIGLACEILNELAAINGNP